MNRLLTNHMGAREEVTTHGADSPLDAQERTMVLSGATSEAQRRIFLLLEKDVDLSRVGVVLDEKLLIRFLDFLIAFRS